MESGVLFLGVFVNVFVLVLFRLCVAVFFVVCASNVLQTV